MSSEAVSISLTPGECRALNRQCVHAYANHPDAQALLDRLQEAEALAIWLRDLVQVDLAPAEASLLRELWGMRRAMPLTSDHSQSATLASGNITI